jgi:hypothetical protein
MALSAIAPRIYEVDSIYDQLPVKATEVIYEGSAIGMTSGYARALVAADKFGGFAMANVTGTAADGGILVTVRRHGYIKLPVTDIAVTDWGAAVYASDDGTFLLDPTSNTLIGKLVRWISTGIGIVAFDTAITTL